MCKVELIFAKFKFTVENCIFSTVASLIVECARYKCYKGFFAIAKYLMYGIHAFNSCMHEYITAFRHASCRRVLLLVHFRNLHYDKYF